jgi:hypothetical protein
VRIARDFGTVAELYPPGITDLREVPAMWFDAIRRALIFISWQENLEEEEQPPRRIWLDDEQLKEHFAAVKQRRKERFEIKGGGEIENPVENEAAKALVVGG